MNLYHGSAAEVRNPDIRKSRSDIDFGIGFYMTADFLMAKKWACNKYDSYLNTYSLDLSNLRVKQLHPDVEWLDYVTFNRTLGECGSPFDDTQYDLIIGPTADDKLFVIADMYIDGLIRAEDAITIMNCMQYRDQYVLKNQDAINQALSFQNAKKLYGLEKAQLREQFRTDSRTAAERTRKLLAELNRG